MATVLAPNPCQAQALVTKPMVVGISSSLNNSDSLSRKGVESVLSACKNAGTQTDLLDLRRHQDIPWCKPDGKYSSQEIDTFMPIQQALEAADAIVIGTPNYKAGPTGALKNLLDILPHKLFENKPVLFVVSGARPDKAGEALTALSKTVTEMGGYPMNSRVVLPRKDSYNKNVAPAETLRLNKGYIGTVSEQFVALAKMFKELRNLLSHSSNDKATPAG